MKLKDRPKINPIAITTAFFLLACNRVETPLPQESVTLTPTLSAISSSQTPDPFPTNPRTPIDFDQTDSPRPTASPTTPPTITPDPRTFQITLECIRGSKFAACEDNLLAIVFEIPAEWGEIEAILRTGGYSGYAYSYSFNSLPTELAGLVEAGGRSKDFQEGRGGMRTDFMGFSGSAEERCEELAEFIPLCEVINPNVVLLMDFPQANLICGSLMGVIYTPLAIIEINLPNNPTINGFRLILPFLSNALTDDLNQDLVQILGYNPQTGLTACEVESHATFDNEMDKLIEAVETNTLDTDTVENITTLKYIASSITFR